MKKDIYQLITDELTKRSFTKVEKGGKVFYTRISFIPIGSMREILEIYEEKNFCDSLNIRKKLIIKLFFEFLNNNLKRSKFMKTLKENITDEKMKVERTKIYEI